MFLCALFLAYSDFIFRPQSLQYIAFGFAVPTGFPHILHGLFLSRSTPHFTIVDRTELSLMHKISAISLFGLFSRTSLSTSAIRSADGILPTSCRFSDSLHGSVPPPGEFRSLSWGHVVFLFFHIFCYHSKTSSIVISVLGFCLSYSPRSLNSTWSKLSSAITPRSVRPSISILPL